MIDTAERIDLGKGCVLTVDKPVGWSSFHLVKKLRGAMLSRLRASGIKKLKVGHAGTLDPLASGVMIVCFGKATKDIDRLQAGVKEYVATMRLGATTPSFDMETPVDATFPTEHITAGLIATVLPRFVGTISQIPPAYSACNVDGERAYKMARKGKEVELKPRTLVIDEIEVIEFDPASMSLTLRIVCQKGTYIRAMARDIGQALGSGAHLTALRRTRVGASLIADALSVDDAVARIHLSELVAPAPDGNEPTVIPPGEYDPGLRPASADPRDILPYNERVLQSKNQNNNH